MGWWSAPDADGIEVGDESLDAIRHFLRDFSRSYQEDLGRKPSLAEFEYALNLAFKANVDDEVLADFAELEIKQVAIKTAKRAKRTKVKPGDIFAFGLDETQFGFGRIVSLVAIGAVAEIFDYVAAQPVFDYSKIDAWLIPPITFSHHSLFEAKIEGDWRVIGETKNFSPGPKCRDLRFVYGDEDDGFFTAVDIFDQETKVGVAEGKRYPSYSSRGDSIIKRLVLEALSKRGK